MADGILTPAMWHDYDIDFARWLHSAMWHVALGWHAIEFAQTSDILEFYIWFRFRPYHRSRLDVSFCTSLRILSKSDHPRQKKMTSCRFSRWRNSAILDFRGPIMGSLENPCTTSYRLSIDTIALNCVVCEKISFFCILATDRQTDKQTNRWTASMHSAASGGLTSQLHRCYRPIVMFKSLDAILMW